MSLIDRFRERLFGVKLPDDYPEDLLQKSNASKLDERTEGAEPGLVRENVQEKKEFPERVLFVCSGNMCRSPYGEARFAKLAGNRNVKVISAGTLRLVGRTAAPEMIKTAKENGLDLEGHRSSAISGMLIKAADVIFVMEKVHRLEIARICPEAESKIVMLGNWLPEPKEELMDPMGREPEVYRSVAHEIDIALERWFEQWN